MFDGPKGMLVTGSDDTTYYILKAAVISFEKDDKDEYVTITMTSDTTIYVKDTLKELIEKFEE